MSAMTRFLRGLLVAAVLSVSIVVVNLATAPPASATACSRAPTNGPVSRFLFQFPDVGHYRLTVPSGLSGNVPLLVDLHGGGGNAFFYEFLTGWPDYAQRKSSFVLAAPDSEIYGFWNFQQGSIDVSFIMAMIDELASRYCIDRARIYVSGHSNGGLMTDRMACDHADVFAAAAPYAGASSTLFGSPCNPNRDIPIRFIHGDSDFNAPIALQEQNRDTWIGREGCATPPSRTTDPYGNTDTYAPCNGGSEIQWRVLRNQGHGWPTGPAAEDMRDRMWVFFNAHGLP